MTKHQSMAQGSVPFDPWQGPLETPESGLGVPEATYRGRPVFALRVRGSAMIEAGIHDGDCLMVEPADTAEDGTIVVAEIDGVATVKRYFRGLDGQVRLQPANSEMLPLTMPGDGVRILGKVISRLPRWGLRPLPSGLAHEKRSLPSRRDLRDERTLDLAVTAIDRFLAAWRSKLDRARERHDRSGEIAVRLGRDLQTLREWCGRTSRPGVRRAVLEEADRIMRKLEHLHAT